MKKLLLLVLTISISSLVAEAQSAYRSLSIAPSSNQSSNGYYGEPRRGDVRLSFSRYETYGAGCWLYFNFYSNGTVEALTRRNEAWKTGTYTLQDMGKSGTADLVQVNIRWSTGKKEVAKLYYYSRYIELSYDRVRWEQCK